jgi:hypothetical protein
MRTIRALMTAVTLAAGPISLFIVETAPRVYY